MHHLKTHVKTYAKTFITRLGSLVRFEGIFPFCDLLFYFIVFEKYSEDPWMQSSDNMGAVW